MRDTDGMDGSRFLVEVVVGMSRRREVEGGRYGRGRDLKRLRGSLNWLG